MAATPYQCGILKRLAAQRKQRGESYVGGGVALNQLLSAPRQSRDIDLFHDSQEAVAATWTADRALLAASGYYVEPLREASSFIEARIVLGAERVIMQWAQDSAFRFFPLLEDDLMGLVLHPFDLATNKVLAMAGRLEPRDWIDVLTCDQNLQPFGYIAWAACGKDPGYNPISLLAEISRVHYSQAELDTLDFAGAPPDAALLGGRWHEMLRDARLVSGQLPVADVGKCVITSDRELFRGNPTALAEALGNQRVSFHEGRLGGSWPVFRE
jgi:hypothetical protein